MPIDPIFGREADLRTAHSMKVISGRGVYFCSENCAHAFAAHLWASLDLNSNMRLTVGVMGLAAVDEPHDGLKPPTS